MLKAISCAVKIHLIAEKILGKLLVIGFANKKVSVLLPDRADTKKWLIEKNAGATTEEGKAVVEWLKTIGHLMIPSVGFFWAGGPILPALTSLSLGKVLGGLTGVLVCIGMHDYEAKIYQKKMNEGMILISAHTPDTDKEKIKQVLQIFKNAGAFDITENDEVMS